MISGRHRKRPISTTLLFVGAAMISVHASGQSVHDFFGTSVTVVNMIPSDQGGESHQDSEPNLAVNPENPMHIAGSAFTPNPMEDEQSMLLAHIQSSHQFRAQAGAPDIDITDNPPEEGLRAPIYVSTDGGATWDWNPIIDQANAISGTNDITLRFSGRGGTLYAALLKGTSGFRGMSCPNLDILDPLVDRADEVFVNPADCVFAQGPRMVIKHTSKFATDKMLGGLKFDLSDYEFIDQPYIQVATVLGHDGKDEDRIFIANNDLKNSANLFTGSKDSTDSPIEFADSRTATITRTLSSPRGEDKELPGLYEKFVLDPKSPLGQNGSGVRAAVHDSGTVYGVFYHFTGKSGNFNPNFRYTTDVVVVRDDNWARGSNAFSSLKDSQDSIGKTIAAIRTLPLRVRKTDEHCSNWVQGGGPAPDMGQERLVGSDVSIAVHPRNKNIVYVAWADSDRDNEDSYNLHVRRSVHGGSDWSPDLLTIPKAKNPALAVNRRGTVGFLYQAYEKNNSNRRWVTHFQRSSNGESWSDMVLATVPADIPLCEFHPYIGDYVHLMAVDVDFYGVFSANNEWDPDNFPQGVQYNRPLGNDGTLRDNEVPSNVVKPSIDPFFFKVTGRWLPDPKLESDKELEVN